MSAEGFAALLMLLLFTGTGVALSARPRFQRVYNYFKGRRYVLYHVAGWSSQLLSGLLVAHLWTFTAEIPADVVLAHGPAASTTCCPSFSWSSAAPWSSSCRCCCSCAVVS